MARKSKTDEEIGYVKAFWMECKSLQADYGVALNVFVHPSDRPAVLVFRIVATPLLAPEVESIGAHAVQFEFPNALRQSLAGALWTHSMKITEMVAAAWTEARDRSKNER